MVVAIVLGNRLNDDASFTKAMIERMNLIIKLVNKYHIDLIVTSGGVANKVAGIAEAIAMKEYLVNQGIDENMIMVEDKSMSTYENAMYSIELLNNNHIDYDTIFVCSSIEHFARQSYNPYSFFDEFIKKPGVDLIFYTRKELDEK